ADDSDPAFRPASPMPTRRIPGFHILIVAYKGAIYYKLHILFFPGTGEAAGDGRTRFEPEITTLHRGEAVISWRRRFQSGPATAPPGVTRHVSLSTCYRGTTIPACSGACSL